NIFISSSHEIIGVMDADLSHDPADFPRVAGPVIREEAELAIGSRHVAGGSIVDWSITRKMVSLIGRLLSLPLTSIHDPMSGFFITRKRVLERGTLDPVGFKILLEVIVKCQPKGITEIPITFRDRMAGESKLDYRVNINYVKHIMRLYLHKIR
ncbi:glycosyltransferase, partial [Candidatus Altiarchaeota archaeon]